MPSSDSGRVHPQMIALPVPQISGLADTLVRAWTENRSHAREQQTVRAAIQARLDAHIETLQSEVERHQITANKEIVLSLIAAAQHVFDRKIDAFILAFERTHALLDAHQAALLVEQEALNEKLFFSPSLSDIDFNRLNARLGTVQVELLNIKKISVILNIDFKNSVNSLSPPRASTLR